MSADPFIVRITRQFTEPAEAVFDAWLDPATAGQWLFATPTGRMAAVEIDARVGGAFRLVDCRDGEDVAHVGEYLELQRPGRIRFVFGVPKYSPLRDPVTLDVASHTDGCTLTLTHQLAPEMGDWVSKVEDGWCGILAGLARSLDTRSVSGPRPVIETDRLSLRRITAEDAGFMLTLLNDPSFHRYIGDRGVRTTEDAVAYIANGPQASYRKFGFGLFLVVLKASGAPMGICGLLKRDTLEHVDIGFAFLPDFWSQGYALESAAACKTYALDTLHLPRLVAIVQTDNGRSVRLLEKIGFTFEKMVKHAPDGEELLLLGVNL